MRKFLVSIVLLCCISSLQAESLIYSTSFTEWSSQTYTSQQMMSYSGIDFTVSNVKIDPNSKPTSVSSYEGTGYLQPSNGSNLSSCYFQTSKLSSVSRVSYTQAAGTIGCGWRLESSNDGVYFYPFNENETGCTSMKTPETKEVTVYMSDVWLRWTPITTGSTTTSIYLMDINIYGDNGEGGMGGNNSQPAVSIAGSMNGWSTSESTFTPNEDGLSASISMYMAAGSYEFKIVLDNSIWRSLNGTNGDLFTFYRDMTSASNITLEDATNFKLNADVDGEYKFTWTYSDNSLSIVFPEQTGMGDGVTYYLIGNSSELGAWNIANALPMNGGLITVNLPAGSYAIKVLDESKNWDTAMGYLNVNNSCSSSGIAMDEDKNAVFVLEESGSVTVSASEGQICLNGAFKVPDVGQYTNFAALVNHDSTYNCYYAGKATNNYSQYLAHVRLNEGDTLRIINRADGNSVMQAKLDSYGLTNNFVSGDYNRYHVCVVGGCYDVYYSYENLYIGTGGECPTGAVYTGEVLPTGWIQLRIKDGQYGNGHVSIDGEGADSYEGKSGIYVLGMELNFEAQPTSGYQFLQWSDNNYANPRPFVVTGDTIIYADFGSLDHYPTGILLNHKKFIRSTYNDGTQLIVRANIQDGDTVELYFLNDNIYWMAELEPYGKYESFSGGVEQGHLICHETGCYDIYFKMVDGITQTIYIGEGTQCFDGEDWTDPNSTSEKVYSVVGTENLFGKAWDLTDQTTVMKPAGDDRYEYNLDSVILVPGGDYQYKVIANHAWNIEEYPSVQEDDNYTITVETPGVYSVLFSLIPGEGCNATTMYMHEIYEEQTPQIVASGYCSADGSPSVTWLLTSDSILTIGGYGAMADYDAETNMAPWYEYKDAYNSAYIASGVTYVGNYAFRQCTNLRYVDLESSVASLGSYCFDDCWYVESITCHATTPPEANGSTFAGVNYMIPIYVPQESLEQYPAAEGWSGFTDYRAIDGGSQACTITSGICGIMGDNVTWSLSCDSVLTISGTGEMENYTYQHTDEIPWYTYRPSIHSVIVSEGVSNIGDFAFYGCSTLTTVSIPGSVTSIGADAFNGCALTSIEIPEGVTYIGEEAFTECRSLTTIDIPNSVTGMGAEAFSYCPNVTSITCRAITPPTVVGNSTFLQIEENIPVFVPQESVTAYQTADVWKQFSNIKVIGGEPSSCIIASGTCGADGDNLTWVLSCDSILTISGSGAMANYNTASLVPWGNEYNLKIKFVNIQDGVTSIGRNAFSGCSNIRYIEIPNSITSLGDSICYNCTNLTSIEFPDNITDIPIGAFRGCTSLISVRLPNNLTKISVCAFMECTNLLSIEIPNSVTTLQSSAFRECSSMTTINLPSNITIIPLWIFYNCTNLTSVDIPNGVTNIQANAFANCKSLSSVDIPSSVTDIGNSAFEKCIALTSITLPNSVQDLGSSAFSGCSNLETIQLPNSLPSIQSSTFNGCSKLQSITIPSDVTSIGNNAFNNCSSLTSIDIPEGVLSIGANAFLGCSGITSLEIPDSVTSIGNLAFRGCYNLETITVGTANTIYDSRDGCNAIIETSSGKLIAGCMNTSIPISVKSIGEGAFQSCSTLKSIIIPDSVTSIGNSAFLWCSALESITCKPITPPMIGSTTFDAGKRSIPVYVPAESIDLYKTTTNWNAFKNIQAIVCDPIASGFCGVDDNLSWEISCDSIFTITGTGAMKTGDDEKWYDMRMSIKKVVIGDGITNLVDHAFRQAENIKEVIIGDGVTKIGESAFWGCGDIQTIVLPSTLDTIAEQAFRSCADLTYIDLQASVKYIGNWAFAYCSYVDSIICRATTPPTLVDEPFYNISTSVPVYVPYRTAATYQSAEGWSRFTNIIELPDCIIASGECGAQGDNVTWSLSCDSVMTISGQGAMANYTVNSNGQAPWAEYGLQIRDIVIEEGVTTISAYGFYNAGSYTNGTYNNVRSVSIPSTVGKMENNYFYQCPIEMVSINSDSIVGKASYSSGATLHRMFGAQVREYYIGNEVKSIANSAFYNQSADSLTTITLPEGLESIGTWAFGYLEHLTFINIPNSVTTIAADAFAGCTELESVVLGESLTRINGQAFWMCDNLTQVTCYAMNPPTLNSTSFDHYDTLIVRCEAKSLYQEADYWKNFTPIMCPDDTTGGYVEPDAPEQITFALDSSWKFIMLPTVFGMIQDDIIVDGGEIEWGTYNSEQRAAGLSGWQGFVPSSGFSASRSYIIRARNGSATLTIKVPEQAREKAGAAIPFAYNESAHQQNANWNFLGNPYPYSFNIMDALDAQGITSPIAVWNGIGYIMYTPGIDVKILEPFEAFFIQMPTNGTEVLQYSPDYIVGDNGGTNSGYNSVVDEYGALSGYFTINSSKEKVQFSRGNLQYNAAKDMWQFAENQYEIIGEGNANISSAYDGWIDLFGWGTGNNPTKTSTSKCDYSSFVDWGINAISNGGNTENMWRTLSANEWTYITGQRTNCDSLCGRATVCGIKGFILLPDDWVSPGIPFQGSQNQGYELNQYSLEDWQKMEAAGAVFLPECGSRTGTEFSIGGVQYWSTNDGTSCYAYDIITAGASDYKLKTNQIGRHGGYGVRLVK